MGTSISELMNQFTNTIPNNNTSYNTQAYIDSNVAKYQDQPEIANQFRALGSFGSGALDDSRENIINAYNIFEESTNPAFRQFMDTSLSQGGQLLSDIDRQKQQAESYYGPGGTAEGTINEYITKYGDLIAQQSSGAQALAKNIGVRSGASEAAVRAGVSQQQALDAGKLIQFQEKKVNDLTNLYNTYNNLISSLRAEASGVNQQYVIQPLAQALDRQSQIAQSLVSNEAQLNQFKLSSSGGTSGGSVMDVIAQMNALGLEIPESLKDEALMENISSNTNVPSEVYINNPIYGTGNTGVGNVI